MNFIDKHNHYGTSVICKLKCVLMRLKHSDRELDSGSEFEGVSAFYCIVVWDVLKDEKNVQTTYTSIEVYL